MGPIRRGLGFACRLQERRLQLRLPGEQLRARRAGGDAAPERGHRCTYAGADVGQGNHTVIAQMAAEMLGLPFDCVRVVASDTAQMGDSGSASASRLTYMSGNAVRGAAEKALAAWQNEDRPAIGEFVYLAPKTSQLDHDTGHGKPNFAYGYVAQVAQVAVDTETGEVQIERFISADDVGQAINPQQVTGPDRGRRRAGAGLCAAGGLQDRGRPGADRQAQHVPDPDRAGRARAELDSIIVEVPDPNGPCGARGMSRDALSAAAAAVVANAVHDATGVRFNDFPLTPERVWRGLRDADDEQKEQLGEASVTLAVVIVDYDPRWPAMYEEEKERIVATLGPAIAAIEHMGSTAVPGLAAKPIIDIMLGIHAGGGAGATASGARLGICPRV